MAQRSGAGEKSQFGNAAGCQAETVQAEEKKPKQLSNQTLCTAFSRQPLSLCSVLQDTNTTA